MPKISMDEVRGGIKVPPELSETFEKMVTAGKKLLYSEEMKADLSEQFTAYEDPVGQLVAESVFGVVGILIKESNNNLPPQLLIPVGVYLISDLADFVEQAGLAQLEDADIGQAMEQFIGLMLNLADGQQPEAV